MVCPSHHTVCFFGVILMGTEQGGPSRCTDFPEHIFFLKIGWHLWLSISKQPSTLKQLAPDTGRQHHLSYSWEHKVEATWKAIATNTRNITVLLSQTSTSSQAGLRKEQSCKDHDTQINPWTRILRLPFYLPSTTRPHKIHRTTTHL